MFGFSSSGVMQTSIVIIMWIIWYKVNVIGITILPNQVYRCTNKNPSPREKNLSYHGAQPLPSKERIVEIFTGREDRTCHIYWSQSMAKIPDVNNTTIRSKGIRQATIMGQVFQDRRVRDSCVWNTPFESMFNRSIACSLVNMEPQKCAEIRWFSPRLMIEGTHTYLLEIYVVNTTQAIPVIISTGAQTLYAQVPCRNILHKKEGFGRMNPYCRDIEVHYKWACLKNITVDVTPADTGEWSVYGPDDLRWYQDHVIVGIPIVSKGGPIVMGRQLKRKILVGPQYALIHLQVNVDIRFDKVLPICNTYIKTLRSGWDEWIKNVDATLRRGKRDLISSVLGGLGTGLGAINTINVEVLASKIGRMGTELNTLNHPLGTSLTELSSIQHKVTDLLPTWFRTRQQDLETILKAVGTVQGNISLALACSQAQTWTQVTAQSIIRDGLEGIIAPELRKIMEQYGLSDFEASHSEWWKMVHFELIGTQIDTHILTIKKAKEDWIYPVIPMGILSNNSMLWPEDLPRWAVFHDDQWQATDLQACTGEKGLGYTCERQYINPDELCFKQIGKCHYKLMKSPNVSMIVSVNVSCVCVRTFCNYLMVNVKFNISVPQYENLCMCNVYSVSGCDIKFIQQQVSLVDIHTHYQLYQNISPVQLGTNLSLIKQLIEHPEMLIKLKLLKEEGHEIDLAVHHSANQIENVLDRVKKASANSWWTRLFSPPESQYSTWKILFTPVVLLCIVQLIVFLFLFNLYMSVRKLRVATWARPTFVRFRNDGDPSILIESPHQGGEL